MFQNRGFLRSHNAGQASSEKTLLSASDFTYLGKFNSPGTEVGGEMHFSRAQMCAKRVDGTLRFWMIGNNGWQRIYSFNHPGYNNTATVINTYEPEWLSKCIINDTNDFKRISSINWIDDQFWIVYTTGYEGTSWNPSYVYTELGSNTSTSYGPWGNASVHSGFAAGQLTKVPSWFQTAYGVGPVANISRQVVQRGSSAHGPTVMAMSLPSSPTTATPDSINLSGSYTVTGHFLSAAGINNPMARPQPQVVFCKNEIGATPATHLARPFWNSDDPAQDVSLDWVDGGQWIDGTSKHGVVFYGQWLDKIVGQTYASDDMPHAWYGASSCPHGHSGLPGWEATGPGSDGLVSYLWITDPTHLAMGKLGTRPLNEVIPTHNIQVGSIANYPFGSKRDHYYEFCGSHYDPVDSILYIARRLKHTNQYGHFVPDILAFQVAA